MKILVVDDHVLGREGVRHALQSLGPNVHVLEAENSSEALNIVEQHPGLDLVLLDRGLPGTDGYATLMQIHEHNVTLPEPTLLETHRWPSLKGRRHYAASSCGMSSRRTRSPGRVRTRRAGSGHPEHFRLY
jgi:response regulator RpfG family c-di-GMP phosphodiesterase